MFRSVRFRLTIWYVGVFAIILVTLGTYLYLNISATASRDVDTRVALQADSMADAVFFFWEGDRLAQLPEGADPNRVTIETITREFTGPHFAMLLRRWGENANGWEAVSPVRVLDYEGVPVLSSNRFNQWQLPLSPGAVANARQQKTVYETIVTDGERIRLITRPVTESGRLLFIVQSATSLQPAEEMLFRLRRRLLSMIPLSLLITSLAGFWLAGRSLRPVERAFRRLRQFSAAASHELRTPLTVMKGEIEVSLKYSSTAEEYREALQMHLSAVNEMSAIVQELLLLARSETGEGAVDWRPIDLTELCAGSAETYQKLAAEKKIDIKFFETGATWILGERRLLERLVSNFVDNAIKHTPERGVVTVRVGRRGGEAYVSVSDTGPGIPESEMKTLFDKFFSRRSPEPDNTSTGLGLGLCRWVAEAHQGRIDVVTAPDRGATFTLWLPISKKSRPAEGNSIRGGLGR